MKAFRTALLGALLLLTPLAVGATGQVGEIGADFTLQDTNDVWHTLSDHSGEVLYLWFVGYS